MSDQYFTVPHVASVNVIPLDSENELPDMSAFEAEIPEVFKLASDVAELSPASLRSLRSVGEAAEELANFLALQSRKINMIMGHVLSQADQPEHRFETRRIGATQLAFYSPTPLVPQQQVQLKLFLPAEALAVYAYAEVTEVGAEEDGYLINLSFVRLREVDQEALIRATLHVQSRLLKQRASEQRSR